MRLVTLAIILSVGCAVFDSTRPHERTRWIEKNQDSEWREYVERGSLVIGMPKDAVFASWNFGSWTLDGDSLDALGSNETWTHMGTGSYVVVCFRDGGLSYFDRSR